MKLYRAETGKRVQIPLLRPNDGLDTLRLAIEKVTRIPQGSQILMTSEGLQLKPDMMFEAITSTDKDEYTIMVYNREVLTTDISSSILTLTEQAKSEPLVPELNSGELQPIIIPSGLESPSVNREWGSRFQRTFEAYVSNVMAHYKAIVAHAKVCDRIMEELRVQALAVQVALTNLDAHSRSVLETFEKFNAFATREFTKQARLLQSFPKDIEALRQIKVHPALLPADSFERYISDFIPTDKLVLWAERCREIHEGLLQDGKDLSRSIKEVQEGTLAIRSNSGINLEQLEDAMADILHTLEQQNQIRERVVRDQSRVKERLAEISRPAGFSASSSIPEALVQLANVYVTDYMDSSRRADDMLRDKLGIFISAKRSQTANLITQLMHISKLQSTIASIPPSLGNLDDSLRKRDADFSQLVYVQRIPIAYGALVVEIVRRREYSKLLLQKSQQLAEVMSRFRQMEQRRRDSFRSEVAKFVPVVVPGLDDVPPFCEINALNTRDRLPPFTREHVTEFERLVNQLSIGLGGSDGNDSRLLGTEQSNAGVGSISIGQESNQDALSKLRLTLTKMTAQMDVMGGEFDRILEKSFLAERIMRLEEENARLRSDMSRIDIQQRSGTPQLAQHSFPRHNTIGAAAGGSIGQGSTTAAGTSIVSGNPPASPKLTRQPSRGGNSAPAAQRADSEEQQQILQQQLQQNQRLAKENTDLTTKIKAYETRIRSLEEKLYQHFHAGSSVDSSVSSKDSRHQPANSDQPWKAPEDIQVARSQSQAKELERKRDEERLLILEQELQDISLKLEETEAKYRNECIVSRQALSVQEELRQELLELKLQSATLEGSPDEGKVLDITTAQKRSDELHEQLRDMAVKYEHLLQHHASEKEVQAVEIRAFKERIDELTSQLGLDKEIMEGQLEQAKRDAEQASERATELENELEVVNEELQNKVLELEEQLENHAAEHESVTARAEEQEKQLQSHRAVYSDILVQLKDQEQKAVAALHDTAKAEEDHAKLLETHLALESDLAALIKDHADMKEAKDEVSQQAEALRKQILDMEAQREAYKVDVNLRLEEAKTMVRRAEEDWKEKSRLLDQMERAIGDLVKPIGDSLVALSLDHRHTEVTTLDQVRDGLLDIGEGIQALINKHTTDQRQAQMVYDQRMAELHKEHQTSLDILHSTMAELKAAHQDAEKKSRGIKTELGSTITRLEEELENVRIQQRASAIPVPVSTTPPSLTPATSTSPVTPMPPSLPLGQGASLPRDKSTGFVDVSDRVLLSTLALDLGISLPLVSALVEPTYPSSSVLLDNSEKRTKSESTPLSPHGTNAGASSSSSTAVPSGSGISRSSSTTIPLSKEILQTFDFSDLNVAETTALIKKKLFDTEHLLKRWQRECKHLKEKYNRASTEAHEKIAFRNFKVDDLTLFLPTRNSVSKPWAAFNINFPHYFLQMTPSMANQLRNREWIVARITSIKEAIVDKRLEADEVNSSPTSSSTSTVVSVHNPFGLADGVKYYLLEATSWNGYHGHGHSKASSSYHSGSRGEGSSSSSSSKLRHHSSTSALNEASSSSRRDSERSKERKDRDHDTERRKHRERSNAHDQEGAHLMSVKEDRLAEVSSSEIRERGTRGPGNSPLSSAPNDATLTTSSNSGANPSLMNLLQPSSGLHHGFGESQTSLATVSTSSSSSTVGTSPGKAIASTAVQPTHKQSTGHSNAPHGEPLGAFGVESSSTTAHLPPTGHAGSVAGHRASLGSSGSAPISIPYQSAATNALRAISSSVGSTGSGGSGSISSLLAHHLGSVGSGSGSVPTMVASSPPRTMLMSSSPHIIGVSTVSAMGTTVSVNNSSASASYTQGSVGGGYQQGHSQSGSSPNLGSSTMFGSSSMSNAPVHPSRLSMSSKRDDLEQLAVFATDEDQEQDRQQQQQQRSQQQRDSFHRTLSSTSTWHGTGL
ncbi:oligomeric, coiled-coil, peripheral membrane protein [Mortierella claussenii]|nr:oligomeric, coiled-coil, peripheral membrane protein [Mortierella claussenii]